MDRRRVFEDFLVQAMDALIEQTDDKTTKILAELFKSAALKNYQDAFDLGIKVGKVEKDVVDKTFEYRFSDVCAAIRTLPGVSDDEKESMLKNTKLQKEKLRQVVYDILARNDVEVIER